MATVSDVLVRIGADLSDLTAGLREAGNKMNDLGGRMQSVGQSIAGPFAAAGVGIAAGLGVAVKTSMDFESQMSRVGAIAGASGKDLDNLRQSALDLGASTSKSASEVAKGQESLAALGFTTKEIISAMPAVISAAEASGADMAQTAEVVASSLNIWGLKASEASRVSDVLAETANRTAADITDMQYALKYAGPPAAALGVSLEETAAAIGLMTNAGMKGEQAGTTLRGGLLALLKPSEETGKMMETLGINITDAKGNFVGLSGLIDNLNSSFQGMTQSQKLAALSQLVGTEAASGFLTLMKAGPAEIDKMTASLENSGGASAEAAAKMKDNLKGAMDELGGAFETAAITIGTALTPAIQAVASVVQMLVDKFNSLSPGMQKTIAIGAAVTAAILLIVAGVAALLAIIGGAVIGFGGLATMFGAISGVAATVVAALAPIIVPILAIVAAIAAVIAIGVLLYKNWDTISAYAVQVWGQISAFFSTLWVGVQSAFSAAWSAITAFLVSTWTNLVAMVAPIFSGLATIFTNIWNIIKNIFLGAILVILSIITGNFGQIGSYVSQIMNNISASISAIWAVITAAFSTATAFIISVITSAFSAIVAFIGSAMSSIGAAVSAAWSAIVSTVSSAAQAVWSAVTSAFNSLLNTVTSIMSNVLNAIQSGWNSAVAFLEGIDLSTIGSNIIDGLVNGIKSGVGAVGDAISSVANKVKDGITGILGIHSPSRVMDQYGVYTGQGFVNGIKGMTSTVARTAQNMARAAMPKMNGMNGLYSTASRMGTGAELRTTTPDVNLYIDSERIARATADANDRVSGERYVRASRARGVA